ncbi:MAG: DUF4876 domain-containing protein [Bacteroidales bacterium]|nr:DUF4876 domain-containing protein [Bacteroidales bacterium]
MMKRLISIAFAALFAVSCMDVRSLDPYSVSSCSVTISLEYPEDYSEFAREGVEVSLEEMNNLFRYSIFTDGAGKAEISLPRGLYRVSVSDRSGQSIFNGTCDKVLVNGTTTISVPLKYSKAGTLVIREIYCGGCKKLPEVGDYQSDKYVILHNNDTRTVYLDSLCFGTLAPYNANSTNPWGQIMDFAPIIQALWQFGGDGTSFPLESGQDAVLCLNGAIDHTVQYPLSVNLNKPDYFVCYNNTYFTNTVYHPAPGDQIRVERILDVVIKVGIANAYAFSISSPTVIIFRPQDISIREFIKQSDSVIPIPGTTRDNVVTIPWDWILDGVEVFSGSTTSNNKRIRSDVDAGFVTLTDTFLGHSLARKVDEKESSEKGFTVLQDTNNSSNDFVELEKATLHE